MSEQAPAEPATEPAAAARDTKPAGANPPVAKARRGGAGLLLVLLLIVLAAVAGFGFWAWQTHGKSQWQAVAAERAELARLVQEHRALADRVNAQQTAGTAWQQTQQERLQQIETRLDQLDRNSRSRWRLEEVGLLLHQAERSLRFERDPATALAILGLVDGLLAGDPNLLALRAAVHQDRDTLQAQSAVDRDGLYLRLNTLINALDTWPRLDSRQPHFHLAEVPAEEAPAEALPQAGDESAAVPPTWQRYWADIKTRLSGLVVVRQRQDLDRPLLSADQEWLLRGHLRLLLQQAQWAVLRAESVPYAAALQQARDWMQRHFDGEDPAVRSALSSLEQLQATVITAEDMSLAASLQALAAQRQQLEQQP